MSIPNVETLEAAYRRTILDLTADLEETASAFYAARERIDTLEQELAAVRRERDELQASAVVNAHAAGERR